jgi:Transposase DDE domain
MYSIYTIPHASPYSSSFAKNLSAFSHSQLLALARLSGFVSRPLRKLDLRSFALSCMVLALQQTCSLRHQAMLLGVSAARSFSKQALHKRLAKGSAVRFLQALLAAAIGSKLATDPGGQIAGFARILLQDSTCISLSPLLAGLFAGPSNQSGKKQASLRIQCLYDLLSERFINFSLSPFTRNDQAASHDLLSLLHPGDMVLRDLGYFTISSLKAIAAKGAFFLSRWRYGVALFSPGDARPIDLSKLLRPGATLDLEILLAKEHQFPVRLLALPLPPSVAEERRRKARANRDKRLSHSEDYLYLLGWNIFVTNASNEQLPPATAAKLYRLRWRIEILFKSWKSHLRLDHISKLGKRQVEVLVYGLLLFAVLMHNSIPLAAQVAGAPGDAKPPRKRPPLSLLRVTQFFGSWLFALLFAEFHPSDLESRLEQQIHTHCRYDSRRRKNYADLLSEILS